MSTLPALHLVILGHVDHGKSTLIGRLLHDAGALQEGKKAEIEASCARRKVAFEWSFLMDALQAERDQAVTIGTTQIPLVTPRRAVTLIDAPGHREFLKHMVTGAAQANAALLVIDAKEGVREQTGRHAYLLHLLGIRQVAVLVNKMDAVGYAEQRFQAIAREISAYLASLGITPSACIPISAKEGANIAALSCMPWYTGKTVLEILDTFTVPPPDDALPLRFFVQDVYRIDERRIIVGRIESGTLKVGDEVLLSPSNQRTRIATLERWQDKTHAPARAGEAVGITLEAPLFAERGTLISDTAHPPKLVHAFRARLFWLGAAPLTPGTRVRLRTGTREAMAEVQTIECTVDTTTLASQASHAVPYGAVAEVVMRLHGILALDEYTLLPRTGRFVLLDEAGVPCAGGIADASEFPDLRMAPPKLASPYLSTVPQSVTAPERALYNHHLGGILWFTGLSGSGKSTLALALERKLFERGCQTYVLDGDNIRRGLNADLSFSHEDRTENIRRISEVAALMADAGIIVITAFISPYREDRRRARAAAAHCFHQVQIKADLATCEKRDVKGLYKHAREGRIADFTGISSPYEEPQYPDLVIDTMRDSIEACVEQLLEYVERQFILPVRQARSAEEVAALCAPSAAGEQAL